MSERQLKRISQRLDRLEQNSAKMLAVYDDLDKHNDLVKKHLLPCGNDLILLTIKGHLLVEHLLEVNLYRLLSIDRIPTGKDYGALGFNQKLQLLRTVVEQREPKPNADLFLAIQKLNEVRNQLAHNLKNQPDVEKDLLKLLEEYHKQAGTPMPSSYGLADELRTCIIKLCKFLHDVRVHLFKLEFRDQAT